MDHLILLKVSLLIANLVQRKAINRNATRISSYVMSVISEILRDWNVMWSDLSEVTIASLKALELLGLAGCLRMLFAKDFSKCGLYEMLHKILIQDAL